MFGLYSCSTHKLFDIKLELIICILGVKTFIVFYTHFEHSGLLPNTLTSLRISNLPNLINLGEGLHGLISLKKLKIKHCENLKLMPKEGFPLNLQSLFITCCESILPSKEWGLHGMKSLTHFKITGGCRKMELFPEKGLLPDNLISLCISRLPDLKYLGQWASAPHIAQKAGDRLL